jgi:alkaline phosphatase D
MNTRPTDRRQLLRLALAASGTLWLPRSAWSQPQLASDPFTLGVASGSPRADSVVLWTRLHAAGPFGASTLPDTAITVRWELAHDERFTRIAARGQAQALPDLAHSVHVEAAGLSSDRAYFYRFMVGGRDNDWVSPVGRTRTLPAADAAVARWRLAYASCQRWEHGHYAAWRHLVADAPDAVAFLGDYIYEYPGALNAVRSHGDGWTLTLPDYRRRYALHKSDAALQAAHAACPWFVIWDDHEVQNDYAGLAPGDSGPAVPDFAARRAAAYQAFYEHMPLRASVLTRALAGLASGAEMRIHGQVRLGRLGSLSLLDARQHKDPLVCTRGGKPGSAWVDPGTCASWGDPARTMLGAAQEQWLAEALRSNAAGGWNLIAQTSVLGPRDFRRGAGQSLWNDGWDGYAAARQRLIDTLQRERVANPRRHRPPTDRAAAQGRPPAGATLAAKLGVSRGTVSNRLRKLEDEQVIVGYTVQLRPDASRTGSAPGWACWSTATRRARSSPACWASPACTSCTTPTAAGTCWPSCAPSTTAELSRVLERVRLIKGIRNTETSILLSSFR